MDNELLTVEKLNCLLQKLIDNGYGDFVLQVSDIDIHEDAVGVNYLTRRINIRESLIHNKDLQAVLNLRAKINKAYEEFFEERESK